AAQTFTAINTLAGIGVDGIPTEISHLGIWPNPAVPDSLFFGTSAAAPGIAAIAALLMQQRQLLSLPIAPSDIAAVLENTAVDLGDAGYDQTFGFGRFDAFAAVAAPALVGNGHNRPTAINSATPTFRGIAPANSLVKLFVDNNLVGQQQLTG